MEERWWEELSGGKDMNSNPKNHHKTEELPLPVRRFVGDLSNKEKLLVGLDIRKPAKSD